MSYVWLTLISFFGWWRRGGDIRAKEGPRVKKMISFPKGVAPGTSLIWKPECQSSPLMTSCELLCMNPTGRQECQHKTYAGLQVEERFSGVMCVQPRIGLLIRWGQGGNASSATWLIGAGNASIWEVVWLWTVKSNNKGDQEIDGVPIPRGRQHIQVWGILIRQIPGSKVRSVNSVQWLDEVFFSSEMRVW